MRYRPSRCVLGAITLIVLGCSSNPLTEEQEYNRQIDLQNWLLCEAVYESSGRPTIHYNHTHRNLRGNSLAYAVKQDLIDNSCRMILRDYWAEGI